MAIKVNEVGNVNTYSNLQSKMSFKAENETPVNTEQKPDTFEKEGMSSGTKVAITIGSLLALLGIGFGIKKHLDTKAIKKVTNEAIEQLQKGTYRKTENVGKDVQETINKILGENSDITPHTYDVSKEFPAIHVYRDFGGYQDGLVTPKGIQVGDNSYTKLLRKATSSLPINGNIPEIKNKVIRLVLADPQAEAMGRSTNYIITFISPNQNYTPLQQDVLKLIEHPEKIKSDVLDKICKFKKSNDDTGRIIFENVGEYENLDYDLILSAVQSMAKGL